MALARRAEEGEALVSPAHATDLQVLRASQGLASPLAVALLNAMPVVTASVAARAQHVPAPWR